MLVSLISRRSGRNWAERCPTRAARRVGRPPYDPVMMLKVLVIQTANNLSDERTEFLINYRLSFMRFLGLGLSDRVPDARTIWLFRERLTKAGAVQSLFEHFDTMPRDAGYIAMSGQIVDSSLVAAPKQHKGGEGQYQGWPHPEGLEGQAQQTPVQGPRRALDGEVHQGQAAGRRHAAASRYSHPSLRLPEPHLDRPQARADPQMAGDGCRRL